MTVSTAPAPDAPRLVQSDGVMVLAVWRSVVVARWKDVPTAETLREVRRRVRGSVARNGAPFAGINFVEARNATTLADDVRSEVTATQREFAGQQRALATIIDGTGFWAATVRSVASGLALVARTPFPQRVFDRIDDAAEWTAPHLPDVGAASVPALRMALETIRAWP